ncbi:MAG: beta-glucosidase [Trebouxia sp. A1-2]|nr:MAG: beta-glucosidase [Trebouxia sp. A1-2]
MTDPSLIDKSFLCGVAVSVYQNSGDRKAQWATFDKKKLSIGESSDFWNKYKLDIGLAEELGCNSFRISIEWSRLFPEQHQLDKEAVQRYNDIFDCLERHHMLINAKIMLYSMFGLVCRAGITPNVTLHWFAHPQWFHELGEFQTEDNIPLFVEWAETAFKLFGKRAQLWATFNEPEVASLCGHITGSHPPGKVMQFKEGGMKLCTMLRAHTAAYKAIKNLPGEWERCCSRTGAQCVVDGTKKTMLTSTANQLWGNEALMKYLKTGVFTYKHPLGKVQYKDPDGKPGCDFFGINHYARGVLDWNFALTSKCSEVLLSDMGYPIDPHSLYKAIGWASQLKVPMYVMENGGPFDKDDTRRTKWINGALEQVKTAVRDGYDLRGYHYWTLLDNFEWNFAYRLKFGLYKWDREDPSGKRTLRNGAKVIKAWYAALPSEMQQVMESQAGKPYTNDRNALPQDSRAPAEASARAHSRAAATAPKHRSAPSGSEERNKV